MITEMLEILLTAKTLEPRKIGGPRFLNLFCLMVNPCLRVT